jgi:hypothetical protein
MKLTRSAYFASLAVMLLSAAPARSQTLLTPWGVPDLQGIWSNPSVIPLERPEA